jgi:predicted GNAT family acetyltransferase
VQAEESESDVRVFDDPDAGRFAISVGGEVVGSMLYEPQADAVALMHTEVRPEFGGRGLATRLIRASLDELAGRGVGVLPYCPFVRRFIAGHDEYAALVPAADRARFGLT